MRPLAVGDVVRQSLNGYHGVDVFTVIEVRGIVQDYSCWEPAPALECVVLWDGQICLETIRLRCLENEYYQPRVGGSILRTEIL